MLQDYLKDTVNVLREVMEARHVDVQQLISERMARLAIPYEELGLP